MATPKRATLRDALEVSEYTYTERGGDPGLTVEEVAEELGISREDVRRIEARALNKLRAALRQRGIYRA